jgi:tetratricopeptide (TPR) repeat protein
MNEDRLKKLMEWEAQKPDDAFLKFAIAQEYTSAENDEEALKYYSVLVERFPGYLPSYYQLGKLYERTGQADKAVDAYNKGKQVAATLKDFKTLRELEEALTLLQDE